MLGFETIIYLWQGSSISWCTSSQQYYFCFSEWQIGIMDFLATEQSFPYYQLQTNEIGWKASFFSFQFQRFFIKNHVFDPKYLPAPNCQLENIGFHKLEINTNIMIMLPNVVPPVEPSWKLSVFFTPCCSTKYTRKTDTSLESSINSKELFW